MMCSVARRNRLLTVGRLLFVIGLMLLCFHSWIVRLLMAILRPAVPWQTGPLFQSPPFRYAVYVGLAGFALIFIGFTLGMVGMVRKWRRDQ